MSGPAPLSATTLARQSGARAMAREDWTILTLVALTWGASFLFIAYGLESFPPLTVAFLRVACGAILLLAVPAARKPVERQDRPQLALLGLVWMAIPLSLFPIAEQWVSSSLAGLLNGGMPITVAVIAAIIHRTRPNRRQRLGLVLGVIGMALISGPSFSGSGKEALGAGLIIIAVCCYGLATNIAGPLQQKYGGPVVMLRVEAFGALLIAPFGLWGLRSSHPSVRSVLSILVMGVLGTGVAFVAISWVLGRVGALRVSMVTYLIPPVSLTLGVVLRGETVHAVNIAGIVIVLSGAFLLSRATAPVPDAASTDDASLSGRPG